MFAYISRILQTSWTIDMDIGSCSRSQKSLFLSVDYKEFQIKKSFNHFIIYLLHVVTGTSPGNIIWRRLNTWCLISQILSISQKIKFICKFAPVHHNSWSVEKLGMQTPNIYASCLVFPFLFFIFLVLFKYRFV